MQLGSADIAFIPTNYYVLAYRYTSIYQQFFVNISAYHHKQVQSYIGDYFIDFFLSLNRKILSSQSKTSGLSIDTEKYVSALLGKVKMSNLFFTNYFPTSVETLIRRNQSFFSKNTLLYSSKLLGSFNFNTSFTHSFSSFMFQSNLGKGNTEIRQYFLKNELFYKTKGHKFTLSQDYVWTGENSVNFIDLQWNTSIFKKKYPLEISINNISFGRQNPLIRIGELSYTETIYSFVPMFFLVKTNITF